MKNALVIAARELEERRFIVYAALGFAILPFILAAVPVVSNRTPREVIALASFIFATGFTAGLAAVAGAGLIGRDLYDGRMSFYFSRPVSSSSIWFGKLAAGILMILGCFGFIIAPGRLAAGAGWDRMINMSLSQTTLAYVLPAALALFLGAHVISTFARSRSPLIAFDFVAAVICGVAIRFLILPLLAGRAVDLFVMLMVWLAIALAVAVIGGGAWQLERGRTDRKRNHLALSQFLWTTMAVALLAAAGWVAWVVSANVSDLTNIRATRSTTGPFAVIVGAARGRGDYQAGFLLNMDDGSTTRIDPRSDWGMRYTRDGRSVVLPRIDGKTADLLIYRLGSKEPIDTGLTVAPGEFFPSDDAARIATLTHENILSVYDVAQKRTLASVRLPDLRGLVRAFFLTADVIRLYQNTGEGLKISELDLKTHALRDLGLLPSTVFVGVYPDASAEHMLVRPGHVDLVTLNDARTGALVRTLASGTNVRTARFLRDGRIVIIDGPEPAAVLHLLSADGTPQRDIALGSAPWATVIGDDGTRVVVGTNTSAGSRHGSLIAVHLNRGVVERREAIRDWVPSGVYDTRAPVEPLRDVFYTDNRGHIVSWNPATGGKKIITGG